MSPVYLQSQITAYVGESSSTALADWRARGGTAKQAIGRADYEIARQTTHYADGLRDAARRALDEFVIDALDSSLPMPKDKLTLEVTHPASTQSNGSSKGSMDG